ncbi:MAG TPA: hypothetical protein VF067_06930 [Sphingomicrobium sp.]
MIPPPPTPVVEQRTIPAAAPVTIEDVRRDPRRWDGKWVRIEGWINRCWSTDCELAENLAARPINQGMTLSFEEQSTFDAWVKPMLPLRARVTARIDATCLLDQICLDRAPVLRGMIVEPLQPNAKFLDE